MRKLLLLLLLLPLAGCFEVEQLFTINPNGTGKLTIESYVTDWTLDPTDRDIKRKLREMARATIDSTRGIEAWRDVSYRLVKGRFYFKGTGYFSDVNRLEGKSLGMVSLRSTLGPSGERVVDVILEAKTSFSSSSSYTGTEPPSQLSIEQQIDSARTSLSMVRSMMGSFLDGMRVRTELALPRPPADVRGYSVNRRGNLEFELTGEKILGALDSMMNDSDLLRRQLNKPADTSGDGMRAILFPTGTPRATITASARPLFDYAREVATARVQHRRIMRELNR